MYNKINIIYYVLKSFNISLICSFHRLNSFSGLLSSIPPGRIDQYAIENFPLVQEVPLEMLRTEIGTCHSDCWLNIQSWLQY
jgi:hypothetical protein